MARYILFCTSILLVSGCAHKKVQQERDRALERTQQFTLYPIKHLPEYTSSVLTRNIAVSTALQKNIALQANFERLGIARADLEKAGVFANPYLDAIFSMPNDETSNPALTFYLGILKVSDLWLVPIKRKIAEDELEIVSWEATTQALQTIRDTQLAYNACVQSELLIQASHKHSQALQNLIATTTHHDALGTLDYKIKTERIKNGAQRKITLSYLQQLMGATIRPDVQFEQKLATPTIEKVLDIKKYITSVQLLQHPAVIISQIRITRAQHQLSYEQGRCMEDTILGYNYVRWFDGISGGGPFFHMSFPIGDTTHAGQSRARAVITQQEREADVALQLIQKQAEKLYVELTSLAEQVELTNNELKPHIDRQLQHRIQQFNENQTDTNKQALLEIMTITYETEQSYINLLFNYYETLINLDYAVGGGILKKVYHDDIST